MMGSNITGLDFSVPDVQINIPDINVPDIGVSVPDIGFNLADAGEILKPLAVLLGEVLVYAIFVFAFYRFMSRRDIIRANLNKYNRKGHQFLRALFYFVEHIIVFPVLIICWGGVLVIVLALLGEDRDVANILLVAVALVTTIRATAYLIGDLARDLAKMLPFAVLGLFLVDKSYIDLSVSSGVVKEIPDHWEVIVYYIIFAVALEFVLRLWYGIMVLGLAPPAPRPLKAILNPEPETEAKASPTATVSAQSSSTVVDHGPGPASAP